MPLLEEITDKIVKAVFPKKIAFFGSYANGTQTADSDVDIFVEIDNDKNIFETKRKINRALVSRNYPIDLIVETSELLKKNQQNQASFYSMGIADNQKVTYERK